MGTASNLRHNASDSKAYVLINIALNAFSKEPQGAVVTSATEPRAPEAPELFRYGA